MSVKSQVFVATTRQVKNSSVHLFFQQLILSILHMGNILWQKWILRFLGIYADCELSLTTRHCIISQHTCKWMH